MAEPPRHEGRRPRRFVSVLLTLALVALAGLGGWWAARATLTSSSGTAGEPQQQAVWAEATEGSVGKALAYSTTVRQPSLPIAVNGLTGVVTETHAGEVKESDVLFVVGSTPVRAVQLDRPAWRDLARGATGEDVAALQRLLTTLKHYDGPTNGEFGSATEAAVKSWQRAERRPPTGTIQRGELVHLAQLPTHVTLGSGIAVGKLLAGGEEAVFAPTGEREFVIALAESQAQLIPAEASVDVFYEQATWRAIIASSRNTPDGNVEFFLTAPDGGAVCGKDCGRLPADPSTILRSQVIVVPRVTGVAVPIAAVRTAPDGSTSVVAEAGEKPVAVLGSGQGLAIVEGVQVGTKVRLSPAAPADPKPAPSSPTEEG